MNNSLIQPSALAEPVETLAAFDAPLALYSGKVMHARMKPVTHRFSYAMSSIVIDIDRLSEADGMSAIFSVNKGNLISFLEKDFGPRDGSPLRPHVNRLMAEAGLAPAKTVLLMAYPRVLGYGFNPISVYFCGDEAGLPVCIIYEVRNTFGEMHSYVAAVEPEQLSPAGVRQQADKAFYVSPFLDMEMRYRFRLKVPSDTVALRILETDCDGPILAATFHGHRKPATSANLLRSIVQTLGLTWKVTGGIHYEALKLWFKGLKIRPRLAHNLSHSHIKGNESKRYPG